ncbi:phosphomevalonate kinase [Lachancea thermotolerans CBS 6340]|uniref:Phosphomevalonate kinase n=1 Tax=Lachancea thermotolerans (strain ATCC 56472 / CBS 6340 / NRRL Y-8284) TaxID=559295 RepID=C5DF69_LACTC|nr:KLTH0D12672p [Lachancea thermotolerans CBS 6340]CAR22824.1 KLTH0D12672p [Lachancea thermotolerans CBS 6340]
MVNRAFSAPGKALLVGGYLVLDPQYRSYVVALSSRMHAVVSQAAPCDEKSFKVTIKSSQFNSDEWNYMIAGEAPFEVRELDGRKNPFAEKVVEVIMNYCQPSPTETGDILVEVYSDPGYHSVGTSMLKRNSYKEFRFHDETITKVPKTGLGSSAGLVTVLVSALLSIFKPSLNVRAEKDLVTIHNLSQVAHCQAQGKVGSGFDVAAAVFGSIMYQRFDPELINNLPAANSIHYAQALRKLVDETDWKFEHENITLPPGFRLIMGDVNNGSETTKLVAKVKAWYDLNYPRSLDIYQKINEGNVSFIEGIGKLASFSKESPSEYNCMLQSLNSGADFETYDIIKQIRQAVDQVRAKFRLITDESGADIEPPVQTQLLDQSLNLKGVLTGMVPGAGGFDAISLIVTDNSDIPSQTRNDGKFSSVTWLNLRQQNTGVKEEIPEHYDKFT